MPRRLLKVFLARRFVSFDAAEISDRSKREIEYGLWIFKDLNIDRYLDVVLRDNLMEFDWINWKYFSSKRLFTKFFRNNFSVSQTFKTFSPLTNSHSPHSISLWSELDSPQLHIENHVKSFTFFQTAKLTTMPMINATKIRLKGMRVQGVLQKWNDFVMKMFSIAP